MDRQSGRAAGSREHGPIYKAIERTLWVLGPAAENLEYCTKWEMPAGTARFDDCVRDPVRIRDRAEQRLRDQISSDF